MRLLICLLLIIATGCTHTRTMSPEDRDLSTYLKRGEEITVYQRSGPITEMRVGKVTDTAVIGGLKEPPFERVEIPISDIVQVRSERIHEGMTLGAVVAGILFLPPVVATGIVSGECPWGC